MPDSEKVVRLDSFDPKRDADLVSSWMHPPYVSRLWGNSVESLDEILERPKEGGDALTVADEVPIG